MTCREKLTIERPELANTSCLGGCVGCPHHYGYLETPDFCFDSKEYLYERCNRCWDREIPETESLGKDLRNEGYELVEVVRCANCVHSVDSKYKSHVICTVEKLYRDKDFFCRNGEPKKN